MTYTYFTPRPATLDEGKALYRKLAAQYHPDHGGDTETMQRINAEWDAIRPTLPRFCSQQAREGRAAYESQQAARQQTPPEVAEMSARLSKMPGLRYDVVGSWIWVNASARHLSKLEALGFKWSANRCRYYWHPAGEGRRRASRKSYAYIYADYGGQSYTGTAADEIAS